MGAEPVAPPRRVSTRALAGLSLAAVALVTVIALALVPSRTDRARALWEQSVAARVRGDRAEALALAQQAIDTDPEFPLAWRALGSYLSDDETARARVREAITRSFELRDRVDGLERLQLEATYHLEVTQDFSAAATVPA